MLWRVRLIPNGTNTIVRSNILGNVLRFPARMNQPVNAAGLFSRPYGKSRLLIFVFDIPRYGLPEHWLLRSAVLIYVLAQSSDVCFILHLEKISIKVASTWKENVHVTYDVSTRISEPCQSTNLALISRFGKLTPASPTWRKACWEMLFSAIEHNQIRKHHGSYNL